MRAKVTGASASLRVSRLRAAFADQDRDASRAAWPSLICWIASKAAASGTLGWIVGRAMRHSCLTSAALAARSRSRAARRGAPGAAPLQQAGNMGDGSGQAFHPLWIATSPPRIGSTFTAVKPASRIICAKRGIGGKRRIDSIR